MASFEVIISELLDWQKFTWNVFATDGRKKLSVNMLGVYKVEVVNAVRLDYIHNGLYPVVYEGENWFRAVEEFNKL